MTLRLLSLAVLGVALLGGGPTQVTPQGPKPQTVTREAKGRALKRIAVIEDFDGGHRSSVVSVEIAWEPGLQPFLVGVGTAEAAFSADAKGKVVKGEVRGGDLVSVVGRPALEVDLRLPAPE